MNTRDFVLLVLDAMGGEVRGKTKLQKQSYFIEQMSGAELSLGYKAHYYGPYAPSVETALDELWSLGLIEKRTNNSGQPGDRGYEKVRYDFSLTEAGRRAVDRIKQACPEDAAAISAAGQRLAAAGNLHYMQLAAAAKIHFILRQGRKPMNEKEIRETARRLNWQLGEQDMEQATGLLLNLDLACKPDG